MRLLLFYGLDFGFETFYEKYQKDDTDPGHTKANTDGADKDNTAGGDKDTSFKPFRWIRENVFGYRDGYEKYPADNTDSDDVEFTLIFGIPEHEK